MKKTRMIILGLFTVLAIIGAITYQFKRGPSATALSHAAEIGTLPVKGMPTLLDLGAHKCIPCKMMAPILKALEKEYAGKAAIVFIDVWENPEQAKKYGIRAIPTQIFYDKTGKEVYRHTGFMDKKAIETKLKELGAV